MTNAQTFEVNNLMYIVEYGMRYGIDSLDIKEIEKLAGDLGIDCHKSHGLLRQNNVLSCGFTAKGAKLVERAKRNGLPSIIPTLRKLVTK